VLVFLVRRLVWAIVLTFVVAVITFVIFFVLPSLIHNPTNDRGLDIHPQFDAEGSIPVQFLHFLRHVALHGDLGQSTAAGIPVTEVIRERLPVTLSLVAGGMVIWLLIAFPIGILSALRPRSLVDKGLMVLVVAGASAHAVWVSLLLSYVFGFRLHWFPVAGYCDFHYHANSDNGCGGPRYWAYHMTLPWLAYALAFAALYARMIRASLLEVLDEDYIRTARAKGASPVRVIRRHALRNAMLPVVTMLGMDVGIAFGGALFVESVFELPGIGRQFYWSLIYGDVPMIMGITLMVSFVVVIVNLVVDILYAVVDPRVLASDAGSGSLLPAPARRRRARRAVGEPTAP
jgi:peptide/nickel transport system permease protein